MEEKTKTYGKTFYCNNCGTGNQFSIPKGTTIKQYEDTILPNKECSKCGCKDW